MIPWSLEWKWLIKIPSLCVCTIRIIFPHEPYFVIFKIEFHLPLYCSLIEFSEIFLYDTKILCQQVSISLNKIILHHMQAFLPPPYWDILFLFHLLFADFSRSLMKIGCSTNLSRSPLLTCLHCEKWPIVILLCVSFFNPQEDLSSVPMTAQFLWKSKYSIINWMSLINMIVTPPRIPTHWWDEIAL